MTGCLATTTTTPIPSQNDADADAALFKSGLKSLEQKGSTAELKKLAGMEPVSDWGIYARSVLKTYSSQQKSINSLRKKNQSLTKENKKLQGNLDKLNQINLELEKRTN